MSEDSLKSLRYALQWLQWANGNIAALLNSLSALLPSDEQRTVSITVAQIGMVDIAVRLSEIKAEVVTTIRRAVDIVSRYTAASLPEPARSRVRGYILSLPTRWMQRTAEEPDVDAGKGDGSAVAVSRVYKLAQESLTMLEGVTVIVGDTLQRAERWCDRLGTQLHEQADGDTHMHCD